MTAAKCTPVCPSVKSNDKADMSKNLGNEIDYMVPNINSHNPVNSLCVSGDLVC